MAHNTHTLPLLKASSRLVSVFFRSSATRLRVSISFSSGVSHFDSSMLLFRYQMTQKPTMIDGMPSARSSHCHPARPAEPLYVSMIQPEIGLPITPATAMAATNQAVRVDRNFEGYQSVR